MIVQFVFNINLVTHIRVHNSQDIDQSACKPVPLFTIGQRSNIKDHVLNIPAVLGNLHRAAGGVVFHTVNALHILPEGLFRK